ncbi:MAG: hypothetical protein WD046_03390 [Paracoccaceae bacterium]
MSGLSAEQEAMQASIKKTALIWGCIGGAVVALIALLVLSGQGGALRFGGAVILGAGAGFGLFKWSFGNGSKAAQCGKCSAAFSITRTDRSEKVLGSEPKESREEADDRSTKVITWMEETYEVTETYTCAKCGDVTTKTHTSSRKKDEKTEVLPAAPLGVAGAMAAGTAAVAADGDADADKSMKGASAAGGTSSLGGGKSKAGSGESGAAPDIAAGEAKAAGSKGAAGDISAIKSGTSKGDAAEARLKEASADEDVKHQPTARGAAKSQESTPKPDAPIPDAPIPDADAGDDPFASDAPAPKATPSKATPSNDKKKG